MNCVDFNVNNETYELVLKTSGLVKLEKALKRNPLDIFMKIEEGTLPTNSELLIILYYCLQANHATVFRSLDSVYDLYDEYVEVGGSFTELLTVILEVFKESGVIPKDTEETKEEAKTVRKNYNIVQM